MKQGNRYFGQDYRIYLAIYLPSFSWKQESGKAVTLDSHFRGNDDFDMR